MLMHLILISLDNRSHSYLIRYAVWTSAGAVCFWGLLPIIAFRMMVVLLLVRFIRIRVVPLSATAKLYFSQPKSNAHYISMYSPSAADFLSAESVSLFFIGQNSCLLYICKSLARQRKPGNARLCISDINPNLFVVMPDLIGHLLYHFRIDDYLTCQIIPVGINFSNQLVFPLFSISFC